MTVTTSPLWIQAGGETAEQARRLTKLMFGTPGIVDSTSVKVTAKGTPDMSVDVAAGQVVVAGSETTTQGYYVVNNDAVLNVAIAAADPTNARIDLIVAKVEDSEYSGSVDAASIVVVTGTAAATPAAPTAPDNSITLARIAVAANATSITTGDITDERVWSGRQFGNFDVVIAASTTSKSFTHTLAIPYAAVPHVQLTNFESSGGGFSIILTALSATAFSGNVDVTGSAPAVAHTVTVYWDSFSAPA